MTTYYIYKTDLEGVYSVSTVVKETTAVSSFETEETDNAAILRDADTNMIMSGNVSTDIQISYILEI